MATFSITITGNRKIEAINQVRAIYNAAETAKAAALTPPGPAVNLTREQYLQMVIDSAVQSWKMQFADQISAALAPTEAAAAAAAKAALDTAAGGVNGN